MLRAALPLLLLLCVTAAAPAQQAKPNQLRIISYNVWYGFQQKPDRKDAWLAWMQAHAPDVVALQELNGYDAETLRTDAATWKHEHVALLSKSDFHVGFTSRLPIDEIQQIKQQMHHGMLRCLSGGIYYYVVHFHPSNCEFRVREADIFLRDAQSLPHNAQIIVVGDFNGFSPLDREHYDADTQLVPFFSKRDAELGERNLKNNQLDYTGLSRFIDAEYIDTVARDRGVFTGTFPTKLRIPEDHGSDRRLDYVLVSPNLRDRLRQARIVRDETTAQLSDHYPVIADFGVQPK